MADPVQRISLADAMTRLRAEAHGAVAGHRQIALVRHGRMSLILFAFERDGALKEHRTDGEVTIHVLAGSLAVTVADHEHRLGSGELVSIAGGQLHSVHALEPSEMLLTVCREATARD